MLKLLLLLIPLSAFTQDSTYRTTHDSTYKAAWDSAYTIQSCTYDTTTIFKNRWWGGRRIIGYSIDTTCVTNNYSKHISAIILPTTHDTTVTRKYTAKDPVRGLMVRQYDWVNTQNPDLNFLSAVTGIVIRINWSDLQPGENTFNLTAIDQALTFAASMKAKGIHIQYKLRVINGIYAPAWLKTKVGQFMIQGSQSGNITDTASGYCVKFWNPAYLPYWQALQNKLAALYDGNEYISEIVNSGTAIGSGEALIRAVGNAGALKANKDAYIAAGYTSTLDLNAVYASINAMKVWQKTNIGMSLTPWQVINPASAVSEESTTTYLVTDSLCKIFGKRADIGNNGLRTPDSKSGSDWAAGGIMYNVGQHFITDKLMYGSSIFYQTATDTRTAVPLTQVLDYGLLLGAQSIELPNAQKQIQATLTQAQLVAYSLSFINN